MMLRRIARMDQGRGCNRHACRRRGAAAQHRRLRCWLLALCCWLPLGAEAARLIEDSAGRKVELPERIERVYAAGPPASILVYVLAPDKLTGWPRAPRDDERPYLAPATRDLPETGRLTGRGNTTNLEVMLRTRPDLIIDFGAVNATYVSLADQVQAQTGIPYLLIDGRFEQTPAALRLVGDILGVGDRGEALASEVEALLTTLDDVLATIPERDRPRVYMARGPNGLETGLKGSINTEIIERAGGRNVADPGDASLRRGIVQVSVEQVIVANPDTIITWDPNFYRGVWRDPMWAGIEAVQRQRVFLSPLVPFGWIDRPPSLNRIIGLKWLASLFYPDQMPMDLRAETRAFYRRFYHVDLDDNALEQLLQWTQGHPPN